MSLFEIGSVPCLIPRLLVGDLGIRWCVSYVNLIIPCNCLVLLVVEKGNVVPVVSALVSLTLEDHESEKEEERPRELPDHECR